MGGNHMGGVKFDGNLSAKYRYEKYPPDVTTTMGIISFPPVPKCCSRKEDNWLEIMGTDAKTESGNSKDDICTCNTLRCMVA